MKKYLSKKYAALSLVVLLMAALVLTACGGGGSEDLSDSKYVGSWKAAGMALGTVSLFLF